MATDSSLKSKKIKGWTVADEPVSPAPATEPVIAGTSETPQPLSLSWHEVMEASDKSISRYRWRQLSEGVDLTADERQKLLENLLGELQINVPNVQMLRDTLQKNDLTSFPVFRAATDWLASQGVQIEPPKVDDASQNVRDRLKRSWEEGRVKQ